MYDVIIVGAGPAGLTSAVYARRANKKVLILEALSYGGQIINTLNIENYPVEPHISGYDFATKLYNQAKDLGAEIIFEKVTEIKNNDDIKEIITTKNKYQSKTVILATGAENRKLGLSNESELVGKGISYCATCDGGLYKGKDVAVQGGGNTAVEDALYLSDIANTVYLIHRRDEFRADEVGINKLKEKENIKNLINVDNEGYIIAGEDCHTNIKGIYVAGDNRSKNLRQLVTATSDGAIAATEAIKFINNLK